MVIVDLEASQSVFESVVTFVEAVGYCIGECSNVVVVEVGVVDVGCHDASCSVDEDVVFHVLCC